MAKKSEEIQPLGYDEQITLAEAQERLAEAEKIANGIMARYARSAGQPGAVDISQISSEDNRLLVSCFGVLLPLTAQQSVQEEFRTAPDDDKAATTLAQAGELQKTILLTMSGFSNSGVRLVGMEGLQTDARDTPPAPNRRISAPKGPNRLTQWLSNLRKR